MKGVRLIAGVLGVAFACMATPAAAQEGGDVTGVLVLSGKGFARGTAEIWIQPGGEKLPEPVQIVLGVCTEAPGSDEHRCKLLADDIPPGRVSSFEFNFNEIREWRVTLSLQNDGDGLLKPCHAAGTTLPAHFSCGPTADKQSVIFQLTGGGQ